MLALALGGCDLVADALADDLALELGDDLIFADSCTVTVYSVVSGQRTVRLPKSSTVWDLIRGGKVGRG
ncbi:MAG: hypothetical protein QGG53_21205 [Planctomycetota bacterium]|nr:hypothetical protein [Planctomycetota bacterium]